MLFFVFAILALLLIASKVIQAVINNQSINIAETSSKDIIKTKFAALLKRFDLIIIIAIIVTAIVAAIIYKPF